MRYSILTLLMVTSFSAIKGQQSGIVTYTETMKMDIRADDDENREIMAMLPKEQKFDRVLYFTPEASLYQNLKAEKKEENSGYEEGGRRVMIRMDTPDEQYYLDITGQNMVQQREVMGRKFLIESKADGTKWKLTGKQDKILNYPCQEATMQDGEQKITAWFTPAIPVGIGPHKFNSLPGLILKIVMDNGMVVMEAKDVQLTEVPKDKIKKPKDGKRVTKEEFRAMMDERRKEMGGDGDGNVIIKVRR